MPVRQQKEKYTFTFQQLRDWALKVAKVADHFDFIKLGPEYESFWHDINGIEFDRGYDPVEYAKPGSPGLYQMKLLTRKELEEWKKRFWSFHRSST